MVQKHLFECVGVLKFYSIKQRILHILNDVIYTLKLLSFSIDHYWQDVNQVLIFFFQSNGIFFAQTSSFLTWNFCVDSEFWGS